MTEAVRKIGARARLVAFANSRCRSSRTPVTTKKTGDEDAVTALVRQLIESTRSFLRTSNGVSALRHSRACGRQNQPFLNEVALLPGSLREDAASPPQRCGIAAVPIDREIGLGGREVGFRAEPQDSVELIAISRIGAEGPV